MDVIASRDLLVDLQPDDPCLFNFGNLGWGSISSPLDVLMIESIFLILWVIVILRVVW